MQHEGLWKVVTELKASTADVWAYCGLSASFCSVLPHQQKPDSSFPALGDIPAASVATFMS